jgi:hypothetical protein
MLVAGRLVAGRLVAGRRAVRGHASRRLDAAGEGLSLARFAGVAQLVEHRFCKPKVKGSSPLASSGIKSSRAPTGLRLVSYLEGCPSGQREQAVNLPASASVGSNPTPSTAAPSLPDEASGSDFAGVAQLVERQPSKLNVAGSTPVSRSLVSLGGQDPGFASFRANVVLRSSVRSGLAPFAGGRDRISTADSRWQPSAHIAQVVERVLGKDEVTSSNLVVGSRGLFAGAVLARTIPVASRS